MKQRIICAGCDKELPERSVSSGVDILYVSESEHRKCPSTRRFLESSSVNGRTVKVEVTGYDPEKVKA